MDDIELSTNPLSPIVSLKKTSRTVHDPVNGLNQPKAIPGATLEYTITAKNTSRGAADAGSTVITDKVPPNMKLCVSNVAPCTAPRLNTVNNSSGLTLASVKYSSNHGADNYGYTPVPDVSGHDSNVTDVKYEFNQRFLGSCGPSIDRHFELKMRMALK